MEIIAFNSNDQLDNRVPQPKRETLDNWHVHTIGRRERPGFEWLASPTQRALLGTIGRPFA
jgi:hypothetical protein